MKGILPLIVLVFGLMIFVLIKTLFFNNSYQKSLNEVAQQLNTNCPIRIDSDTRLDSATVLPGKTLQYNYTMIRVVKDSINLNRLKVNLSDILLDAVKKDPSLKPYRDHNVTLVYRYVDKAGSFVTKITISPKQYKLN